MVFVKKSTLPGAGKGLFTEKDIKKGKNVCEYEGELITWADAIERNDVGKGGYVYYINKNACIDAFDFKETFGRYANDAAGVGRVNGHRNNAVYHEKGKKVFIRATRNIQAGSEVFVSYGRAYWNIMKEEMAEKEAKKKKKKSRK
ncbi:MAG: SET domain-containing protein [Bacteroidetes bacterium]|nr:SET domain-containing protein [Bacteroidota bacterium]